MRSIRGVYGVLQAVAIDGKSLCGTLQPHARVVHSEYGVVPGAPEDRQSEAGQNPLPYGCFERLGWHQAGRVLSQQRVDEKTNEVKAALDLLKTILLPGRIVRGDAMF